MFEKYFRHVLTPIHLNYFFCPVVFPGAEHRKIIKATTEGVSLEDKTFFIVLLSDTFPLFSYIPSATVSEFFFDVSIFYQGVCLTQSSTVGL